MKAISGKQFCKLVEGKGWVLKRINGSHPIHAKSGDDARISVPVHGNTPLKLGLQRHLRSMNLDVTVVGGVVPRTGAMPQPYPDLPQQGAISL